MSTRLVICIFIAAYLLTAQAGWSQTADNTEQHYVFAVATMVDPKTAYISEVSQADIIEDFDLNDNTAVEKDIKSQYLYYLQEYYGLNTDLTFETFELFEQAPLIEDRRMLIMKGYRLRGYKIKHIKEFQVVFGQSTPETSMSPDLTYHFAHATLGKTAFLSAVASVEFIADYDYSSDTVTIRSEMQRQFLNHLEKKEKVSSVTFQGYAMGDEQSTIKEKWAAISRKYKDQNYKLKIIKGFVYD